MTAKIPVSVLGATGTVGQKFVRLLADHPWFEVAAVAASVRERRQALRRGGPLARAGRRCPSAIAGLTVAGVRAAAARARSCSARSTPTSRGRSSRRSPRAGALRGDQHPEPPDGRGRPAAHSRRPTSTTSALVDRQRRGARLARRHPRQPQLLHRRAGPRAGAAAPGVRHREAVRVHDAGGLGRRLSRRRLARHPRQRRARTSAARRRRSSARAGRSSARSGPTAWRRPRSRSARTPTGSPRSTATW